MKCCITGNRPQKLPFIKFGDFNDINYMEYIESMYYQIEQKIKMGYDYFISGAALGVDLDFAEAVIYYRDGKLGEPQDIKLEIAVPCDNQTRDWNKKDVERYNKILALADKIVYVSHKYTFDCMQKRNEYMVDNSELVLAFWNGETKGGTYNTIKYARKNNKQIEITNLKEQMPCKVRAGGLSHNQQKKSPIGLFGWTKVDSRSASEV